MANAKRKHVRTAGTNYHGADFVGNTITSAEREENRLAGYYESPMGDVDLVIHGNRRMSDKHRGWAIQDGATAA